MPGDDPGEIVKAGAEGAAAGAVGALVEPIAGFLGKLLGSSAEQLGGWAGDVIAFRRWKMQVRIAQNAEAFLADAGLERSLEAATEIAGLAPWGVRLTKRGIWTALEIPSEQAAVEFEDRQQIMATFGEAPPEAIAAFLEKRTAQFAD